MKKAGIVERKIGDEMLWYFDKAFGEHKWPKINGKSLNSFPNQMFNKTKEIGNETGIILNPQELAKMFEALGLRVASENEYIIFWKEQLLAEKEELETAGIIERIIDREAVWSFDDNKNSTKWPKIGGKSLKTFPSCTFNKEKEIGDKNGVINNPQELAKMFEVL